MEFNLHYWHTIFLINTVNLLWRFLFWIKLYIKVMWHTHNECNNLSHTWSLSVEFCSHSLPFIRQPLLLSTSGIHTADSHTRFRLSLILDHFLKNFNYLWRSSCRSVLMRPAYTDSLTARAFPWASAADLERAGSFSNFSNAKSDIQMKVGTGCY